MFFLMHHWMKVYDNKTLTTELLSKRKGNKIKPPGDT